MMKISRYNYEEWAIGFIEDTLAPEERAAFENFLKKNKDISEIVNELLSGMPVCKAEKVVFPDKRKLYRGKVQTVSRFRRIGSLLGGAAAAVILLGLIFALNKITERQSGTVVADEIHENNVVITGVPGNSDIFAEATSPNEKHPATDAIALKKADAPEGELKTIPVQEIPARENVTHEIPAAPVLETVLSSGEHRTIAMEKPLSFGNHVLEITTHAPVFEPEETFGTTLRQSLAMIIAPFDELNPIRTFRTEEKKGIEIASIRIGTKIK